MSTPGYGDSGDSAGCNSSCTRGFGSVFSFAFGLHPVPVRDAAPTDAAPTDAAPTDAASACVIEVQVLFARVLGQEHRERFSELENRIFRGDGGIGAAPRLAAAHRAADTNAPGGCVGGWVCVCVCVCVRERVCVCVCVFNCARVRAYACACA